ncbi:MAG: transposase, partial [Planctomycetaceae bacterium]|nr:transposase [Planctomycetaceae bacterium]
MMIGILFAQGRRVVAAWIRTAGESDDYQDHYDSLQTVGRSWKRVGMRLLAVVLKVALSELHRVLLVIDDSPTKRYGPKVQGAGIGLPILREVKPPTGEPDAGNPPVRFGG